jgi:hypothetical protein
MPVSRVCGMEWRYVLMGGCGIGWVHTSRGCWSDRGTCGRIRRWFFLWFLLVVCWVVGVVDVVVVVFACASVSGAVVGGSVPCVAVVAAEAGS